MFGSGFNCQNILFNMVYEFTFFGFNSFARHFKSDFHQIPLFIYETNLFWKIYRPHTFKYGQLFTIAKSSFLFYLPRGDFHCLNPVHQTVDLYVICNVLLEIPARNSGTNILFVMPVNAQLIHTMAPKQQLHFGVVY